MTTQASDTPEPRTGSRFVDVFLVVLLGVGAGTILTLILFQILDGTVGPVEEMSDIVVGSTASGLIYVAMLPATYLLVVQRRGLSWADIGLRTPKRNWVGFTVIVWAATFLGMVAMAILVTNLFGEGPPDVSEQLGVENQALALGEIVWLTVVSVVVAPIAEEIVFRGLLFDAFRSRWSFPITAAGTAFLFAASHQALLTIPGLMVLGIGLAWLRERFDSVYPAVVLHVLNNALAISVLVLTTNAGAT